MADLELIDRIIRLGEVASAAPDDVRQQLVLTLKWINCPVPMVATLGGNTEDACHLREMIILGEGYREPGAARAGCTCGARQFARHAVGCPRRPLRDPVAEGMVTARLEEPGGRRVMPETVERGVDMEELPQAVQAPASADLGGEGPEGGTPPSMGPS